MRFIRPEDSVARKIPFKMTETVKIQLAQNFKVSCAAVALSENKSHTHYVEFIISIIIVPSLKEIILQLSKYKLTEFSIFIFSQSAVIFLGIANVQFELLTYSAWIASTQIKYSDQMKSAFYPPKIKVKVTEIGTKQWDHGVWGWGGRNEWRVVTACLKYLCVMLNVNMCHARWPTGWPDEYNWLHRAIWTKDKPGNTTDYTDPYATHYNQN